MNTQAQVIVRHSDMLAHERIAAVMQVTAADDSLAIESSILGHPEHMALEEPRAIYQKWWVKLAVGALAVWMWLLAWLWRFTIGLPYRWMDKAHWGLGPVNGSLFFDRIHWLARQIRRGVTTSEALDATYAAPIILAEAKNWRDKVAQFWFWQPDASSVRNRLRITYQQMFGELERLWKTGQREFRVLSLACGSAQASIEALATFLRAHPDADITLTLVDLSKPSLRRAARLAQARGASNRVIIMEMNLRNFLSSQRNSHSWDIVEMVGFLDYRTEESVIRLTRDVLSLLKLGGLYIAAHIAPAGIWSFVTAEVHRWHFMERRTAVHYMRLLLLGGFLEDEIRLIIEGHRIHPVSLCRLKYSR